MDKYLRSLERLQDPLRLKLLQRRLRMGVYIQEAPRPIKVFNDTELLINIHKCGYEREYIVGNGNGYGYDDGDGYGFGDGSGDEYGYRDGYRDGYGSGCGLGKGSELGESEGFYTQNLREKHNG